MVKLLLIKNFKVFIMIINYYLTKILKNYYLNFIIVIFLLFITTNFDLINLPKYQKIAIIISTIVTIIINHILDLSQE